MGKMTWVVLCSLAVFFQACNKGPSEEQVREDWEQYAHSDRMCTGTVEFRKIQIIGRSVQENRVEILLEVTGNWVQDRPDHGWFAGPCNGFHRRNGRNQVVVNKAIYTKYDTGWRAEKNFMEHAFSRVE